MVVNSINGELLLNMFRQATYELNMNKQLVDALNVFPVPDGDTGTNMSLTMNSALNEAMKVEDLTVENVGKAIAKGSLLGARGNSGVILSQIFRGFAKGCEGKETLNSIEFLDSLVHAKDTAYKAVLKPVEGTILTVIRKTSQKAEEYMAEEVDIVELMGLLIDHANLTLDRTPEYLDVLKQAGVVDAGGKGLVCIFDGFYSALSGGEIKHVVDAPSTQAEAQPQSAQMSISAEDIKFAYCTEFIIQMDGTEDKDVMELKKEIERMGDSMVFVQDEDIIKVHIHTNNPGLALEDALAYGELINIKIENMRQQHSSIIQGEGGEAPEPVKIEETVAEPKKYAFVSVSMGEGISRIFTDLGVDHIISGGQTMNPSTEDIKAAVDKCNAENIIILPNNSNIILAAKQAQELSDKNVIVIPTKTVPQGITAMLAFDMANEPEQNEEAMTAVISDVKTVQVTFSVRDTVFNDIEIKENDILGVADGTITSVGSDISSVAIESIEKIVDEDSEILTVYYGEEVTEEEANALAAKIEEEFEDMDIEVYSGGQPLYYYIFSIE